MEICGFEKQTNFFLVGIGGISMSAIAKYLLLNGYTVCGDDLFDTPLIENLRCFGAQISIGNNFSRIPLNSVVIYNSAIKFDDEIISYLKKVGCRIYTRAEFLSLIAKEFKQTVGISGCHGKTTATCMMANVLNNSKFKYFSHIGGEDLNLGNFSFTGKEIFLSEICEFKRNINYFTNDIACVLNVGLDHVDCYNCIDDIKSVYFSYLDRADKRIINLDDEVLANYEKNAITYSLNNKKAKYIISAVEKQKAGTSFVLNKEKYFINTFGLHNVYNAVNAIAISKELDVSYEEIYGGLLSFKGVKRRFEKIGQINNAEIICDYAHHPDEIKATIKTALENTDKRVRVLFQPHTYSRTKKLLKEFIECFNGSEETLIYKTYPAREDFDKEGSAEFLSEKIGGKSIYFDEMKKLKKYLHNTLSESDLLLVLGAGDIYNIIKNCLV